MQVQPTTARIKELADALGKYIVVRNRWKNKSTIADIREAVETLKECERDIYEDSLIMYISNELGFN